MASESAHIKLANRNHDLLLQLLNEDDPHLEWITTIAFYKAVHVVEAVFVHSMKKHSTSHADRNSTLQLPRFAAIYKSFSKLYRSSRIARYLMDDTGGSFESFADYADASIVREKFVKKQLFTVEQQSLSFLSDSAKTALSKIAPSDL